MTEAPALTVAEIRQAKDAEALMVRQAIDAAYAKAGYVDSDGVPDPDALLKAANDLLQKDAVVGTEAERSQKAIARRQLMVKLFPGLPGNDLGDWDKLDPIEQQTWDTIEGRVWRLMNPAANAALQRKVGEGAKGLVLIRTSIGSGQNASKVVYLTNTPELILKDYRGPLRDQVRKAAQALAGNLGMVALRNPGMADALAQAIAKDLGSITTETTATFALTAPSKE